MMSAVQSLQARPVAIRASKAASPQMRPCRERIAETTLTSDRHAAACNTSSLALALVV